MASLRTGAVTALLLAALAGCGLSVPGTPGAAQDTPNSAVTEDTSLPATEGPPPNNNNGPPPPPAKPYVAIPTMAAGGQENTPGGIAAGVHCLDASNLGAEIPAEVMLTITDVRIVVGGSYFTLGGTGCDTPACKAGLRWTQDASTCSIAVTEKGKWRDHQKITVLLVGQADCAPGQRAPCERYRDAVHGKPPQVGGDISSTRPPIETTATAPATS